MALGRSSEEKVKGHSEAIYSGPPHIKALEDFYKKNFKFSLYYINTCKIFPQGSALIYNRGII